MSVSVISVAIGLTVLALCAYFQLRARRRQRVMEAAISAGLAIDKDGNINAGATYGAMVQHELESGVPLDGKKSHFMELMRICAQGPTTIDDIRFLFAEGIEPVVRPDGLVYVPCIENEHLYMEGEVELQEEDLDRFIEGQGLKLGLTPQQIRDANDNGGQA